MNLFIGGLVKEYRRGENDEVDKVYFNTNIPNSFDDSSDSLCSGL